VPVDVQPEPARHRRPGAVRADGEAGRHAGHRVRHAEPDPGTGPPGGGQRVGVDAGHVGHPELVARADQLDRPAQRRRIEHHPADRRPELPGRQVEVLEGAADEDAGGPDARVEGASAVDDQHVVALPGEQPRGVQPGQAGTHDEYVHGLHARRR
jgi:hypothetical protein